MMASAFFKKNSVLLCIALLVNISGCLATDPTFCAKHKTRTYDCNCHKCRCDTCYNCACHVKKAFWSECDYPSCGDTGCWCSPYCKCCHDTNCASPCRCEQCCDQCTLQQCTDLLSYHASSLDPPAVPSDTASRITITGGSYVNSHTIKCRFGATISDGTYVSPTQILCMSPVVASPVTVAVDISLDNGAQWTSNALPLTLYSCPAGCSGHGSCHSDGTCGCSAGYTGADCSLLCPGVNGSSVCSGRGQCTLAGACACRSQFWGSDCSGDCPRGLQGLVCSGAARGQCVPHSGACACAPGYAGSDCSHVGTCNSTAGACSGHGLCATGGACFCVAGFWGSECQFSCPSSTPAGASAPLPCSGRAESGTCSAQGNCTCKTGYFGVACESICPGGANTPCSGHGRCGSDGVCSCQHGWRGGNCSLQCPGGASAPCSNAGTCTVDGDCDCAAGRYGGACQHTCPGMTAVPGGAPLPCSGHGLCLRASGACACHSGYFGPLCDGVCPGGASTPCSLHGVCDSATGSCACVPGYYGSDCAGQCPRDAAGAVCGGHGTCNATTGACACNAPFSGANCTRMACVRGCYGHGTCRAGGCSCSAAWTGQYCSIPVHSGSNTGGGGGGGGGVSVASVFSLHPSRYTVSEAVGTVLVNVTRGGALSGPASVWFAVADVTATRGQDFTCPQSGQLLWPPQDGSPKSVKVTILDDNRPEGLETFQVTISRPSNGSIIGGVATATVAIASNDNSAIAQASVQVAFRLLLPSAHVKEGTSAGELFKRRLTAELAAALSVAPSRVVLERVEAAPLPPAPPADATGSTTGGGDATDATLVTFVILAPTDSSQKAAGEVATTFVSLVGDTSSALYQGTEAADVCAQLAPLYRPCCRCWALTRLTDVSFQPTLRVFQDPAAPPPPNYAWLVPVLLLPLLLACAVAGYVKRRPLVEWLMWKLGNFRFRTMHSGKTYDWQTRTGGGSGDSSGDEYGGNMAMHQLDDDDL